MPSSAPSSPSCAASSAGDLARKGYAAKTIGIKLRFDDFRIATRALTLPAHTLDGREIRRVAGQCLKRVELTRRLRLLGVRASNLEKLSELVAGVIPAPRSKSKTNAPPTAEEPGLPLFDNWPGSASG